MSRKPVKSNLLNRVRHQLFKWANDPDSRIFPRGNIWIYAKEGAVYLRLNRCTNGVDLASFEIEEKYQRKGIARSIIEESLKFDFPVIKIENIGNLGWAKIVKEYYFPGFTTKVTDYGAYAGSEPLCYTVEFIKKERINLEENLEQTEK